MKKRIAIAVMAALIVSLSGCGNTDQPQTIQNSSGIETVTREVDESTVSDETPTDSFSESEESPTDNAVVVETEPPQAEVSRTIETQSPTPQSSPAESHPAQIPAVTDAPKPEPPQTVEPKQEEPKPTEQTKATTAADCQAIADKIIQYINSYRSTPAAKLPGLTTYAEYRSRQLVSNFAHDTTDERAAATALQYGEYVEPSLYGMTGDPYYTACARDAIAKAAYHGTVDEVAKQFALLVKNSAEHWAYVGDASYQYIAVGLTYDNGTWYCDIAVAMENTDNK